MIIKSSTERHGLLSYTSPLIDVSLLTCVTLQQWLLPVSKSILMLLVSLQARCFPELGVLSEQMLNFHFLPPSLPG